MFFIKSYIKKPDIKITNLVDLKENPSKYYIDVEQITVYKTSFEKTDLNFIEGVIYMEYKGMVLLDIELWDYIVPLWAYLLNMLEEIELCGKAETYFPDQPVKIKMYSKENIVHFSINEGKKQALPRNMFVSALLETSELFFRQMSGCFGDNQGVYAYQLERVDRLRTNMLQS